MSQCQNMGSALTDESLLREHFPYINRGHDGEFIVPADRVEQFARKILDLMDNREHLERIKQYRKDNHRPDPSEIVD